MDTVLKSLRAVPGYPGWWASPCGKIYSTKRNWRKPREPDAWPRRLRGFLSGKRGERRKVGWSKNPRVDIYVHRLVAMTFLHHPIPDGMIVDHIDRNPLNNHVSNLRVTTHSINCANQVMRGHNTSGARGAYYDKRRGHWYSTIHVGDRRYRYLGRFGSAEAASDAYCAAFYEKYGFDPPETRS